MVEPMTTMVHSRDLFLPAQAIQAFRDTQYRSTALAIAELIDNSIDARADKVEVLCLEQRVATGSREPWKIHELAVIDNGSGMASALLMQALKFGARMAQNRRTIGKYGMGLPTSSVSQCSRVDVWTWQTGIENSLHCYIDVDEIKQNAEIALVPEPNQQAVPSQWTGLAKPETLGKSGTLVVWSKIDRIKGRATTIFNQIEEEVGRIYRHFINENQLAIRLASARDSSLVPYIDNTVKPNDPLYLMKNTSTPSPYGNDNPMFREWGRKHYSVTVDGKTQPVEVVYSLVKDEVVKHAREVGGRDPGHFEYGKHAARNRGVSVVREDREILMENAFVSGGGSARDPQNRWWGCEVRFGSGCDSLFGIDPNKQMAAHFSGAAKELVSDEDTQAILDGLSVEDEDLYKITADIRNNALALRREVTDIFGRYSESNRQNGASVTSRANEIAKRADKEAFASGEQMMTRAEKERTEKSEEERIESVAEALVSEGFPQEEARETAREWIEKDDWYSCTWANLGAGSQMFKVSNVGGIHRITLNTEHPIYEFVQIIQDASRDNEEVRRAAIGVILLLQSWGKMEDQVANPNRRRDVQNTAIDWGRQADEFIRRLNEGE